jgi:hypothetical protein
VNFLADEWIMAAGEGGHAPLKREFFPPASPQDSFSALAGVRTALPGKDAPAGFSESCGAELPVAIE